MSAWLIWKDSVLHSLWERTPDCIICKKGLMLQRLMRKDYCLHIYTKRFLSTGRKWGTPVCNVSKKERLPELFYTKGLVAACLIREDSSLLGCMRWVSSTSFICQSGLQLVLLDLQSPMFLYMYYLRVENYLQPDLFVRTPVCIIHMKDSCLQRP